MSRGGRKAYSAGFGWFGIWMVVVVVVVVVGFDDGEEGGEW